jgi:hypothetical protein
LATLDFGSLSALVRNHGDVFGYSGRHVVAKSVMRDVTRTP